MYGNVPQQHITATASSLDQIEDLNSNQPRQSSHFHDGSRNMNKLYLKASPSSIRRAPSNTGSSVIRERPSSDGMNPYPSVESLDTRRFALGGGNHRCPICEKTVTHGATNFRSHYMTHTGEKPYKCPHCDYRATQISNVKTHINFKHMDILSGSNWMVQQPNE